LRFYGFDLSSIDQEANVTVNIKNSNTTELSMTTIGIISPEIETIISNNTPVVTTMSMDTITPITMLSSSVETKSMETTTLPSTATNITQKIMISTNTDVQTTSTLVTNSPAIAQSASSLTMQLTDSLTVTSGKSVQPSTSAENVMGLSFNPMLTTASTTSMDNQTNSNRVIMTTFRDNQSSQISSTMMNSDTVTIGTIVISMDADTPTISTSTTDSVAVTQNMTMQSVNSLTAVTSIEPSLSADAKNMANSSRTLLSMMNNKLISALSMGQTNMTIVGTAADQSNRNSEISSAIAININNVTATNIFPNVNMTKISNMNVQIPDANVTMRVSMNDSDRIASMKINDEISTFAANIDVPMTMTNVLHLDSSTITDTNTKILAPATTTINMIFINASVIDTFNTTTPKTLMSTTSTSLNSASVTISTSVNTITGSNIDSQLTEILTMPDIIEVTTLRDFTTMPFITDVNDTVTVTPTDDDEVTITSSLQRINFTSGNIVGNIDNSAIANSMINSVSNDEIVVNSTMNSTLLDIDQALVNQSIVSLNRKKKTAGTATIELESDLNMMNDVTIANRTTNKLNNRSNRSNRSNLYKRTTKGPRRYFSSYPGTIEYLNIEYFFQHFLKYIMYYYYIMQE